MAANPIATSPDHGLVEVPNQRNRSFDEVVFKSPSYHEMLEQTKIKLLEATKILDQAREKAFYRQAYEDISRSDAECKLKHSRIELEKLKLKCQELDKRVKELEKENAELKELNKEISSW